MHIKLVTKGRDYCFNIKIQKKTQKVKSMDHFLMSLVLSNSNKIALVGNENKNKIAPRLGPIFVQVQNKNYMDMLHLNQKISTLIFEMGTTKV